MKMLLLPLLLLIQGLPLQVLQTGTISGTLKNAQGNALPGIRMAAVAKPDSAIDVVSGAALSSIVETDDNGRFTLENIPPGHYYIAAGRLDGQTYYPGTTEMSKATEVVITPGIAITGIDFALSEASFGRATGAGAGILSMPTNA